MLYILTVIFSSIFPFMTMPPDIESEHFYQSIDRPLNSTNQYDVCINILKAIASLSSILLAEENLNYGVNRSLEILGKSIKADRLNLHKHYEDPTGKTLGYVAAQYEWISEGTESQIDHPHLNSISYHGIEEYYHLMLEGKPSGGSIDALPEPFRSGQLLLEVKTTYAIPILVKGEYWGVIALDFCHTPRLLTVAETEILKTAASCIGGAIEREHSRIAKEKAELAILDERNRMAREIHDTLAQAFTGISLQLEAARNILTTQP